MVRKIIVYSLLFSLALLPATSQEGKPSFYKPPKGTPKNFVIILAPGMGAGQLSALAMAKKGEALSLSRFPVAGFTKPWSTYSAVPDDAALATAIATGVPTEKGMLGVDPKGKKLKNLFEWAKEKGMGTGLVVTGSVLDPIPAAFALHEKEAKTPEQLAEAFTQTKIDFVLGAGGKYFTQRTDGRNLLQPFKDQGYEVETKRKRVGKMRGSKVMAILEDEKIYAASSRGSYLPDGARNAIQQLLSYEMGYMLVIDAAQIQAASTARDMNYLKDELLDLDATVEEILKMTGTTGETLVLVVGMQEAGGLVLENGNPDKGKVQGVWAVKGNSAAMTPVFAAGAGAEQFAGIFGAAEIFPRILDWIRNRK